MIKLHHAITDGIGAVKIAMHLFDIEREVELDRGEVPEAPQARVLGQLERIADALVHEDVAGVRLRVSAGSFAMKALASSRPAIVNATLSDGPTAVSHTT